VWTLLPRNVMMMVQLKNAIVPSYVVFRAGAPEIGLEGCEAEQRVGAGRLVSGTSGNQVP
jgi:hypothetical protein